MLLGLLNNTEFFIKLCILCAIICKTIYNINIHHTKLPYHSFIIFGLVTIASNIYYYYLSQTIIYYGRSLLWVNFLSLIWLYPFYLAGYLNIYIRHCLKITLYLIYPEIKYYLNDNDLEVIDIILGYINNGVFNNGEIVNLFMNIIRRPDRANQAYLPGRPIFGQHDNQEPVIKGYIIESDTIAKCNICHDDKKIIHINIPFTNDSSCSNCTFATCKDCFHTSISRKVGVEKYFFTCEICKDMKCISDYVSLDEYLQSIILDTENYNISRNNTEIIFTHKITNAIYAVKYCLHLTSKYNISPLLTLDKDIDMSWNLDKFKFITKRNSKQLYIIYKLANVSFLIENFEYEDGRFYCKFNIFGFEYILIYTRYNNIWISEKNNSSSNPSKSSNPLESYSYLQPDVQFDERNCKSAYNYFKSISI